MPTLPSVKTATWQMLLVIVLLGTYGFAFEYSYFKTLGADALLSLGLRHYVFSGFTTIATVLAVFLAYALIRKFFSKNIEKNELDEFLRRARETKFADTVGIARLAMIASLLYWIAAVFEPEYFDRPRMYAMFAWMLFFVIQGFLLCIFLSPPAARAAVVFAFFVSTILCTSSFGIGSARYAKYSSTGTNGLIRDDLVVKVRLVNGVLLVEPKPMDSLNPILAAIMKIVKPAKA